MSGSTIGGIVGGVVGWFVGGPAGAQWGFMIGSAVGAIVAPEQFEGPRLAEAKTQTANDGVPLIYGYGTFPCSGNLAWVDEVKEHKKTESQKGGPEVTTYTYTVSYMIVVCQGEISGYKLIKRNGKIVYDARTDAELSALGYSSNEIAETRANQSAFLQRATLYYGTQTQMPDPTMVAVEGAGNVPAYTGIAYIVLKDDETREGEVSQYEFVVASCGERTEDVAYSTILITGSAFGAPGSPHFARATISVHEEINFVGIDESTGADINSSAAAYYNGVWLASNGNQVRYSTDGMETWQSGSMPISNSVKDVLANDSGWFIVTGTTYPTQIYSSGLGGFSFELTPWVATNPSQWSYLASSKRVFKCGSDLIAASSRSTFENEDPQGEGWDRVLYTDMTGFPNIQNVLDMVEHQGKRFAILQRGRSIKRWCIGVSDDDGHTFDPENDVLDIPNSGHVPIQLCVVGRSDGSQRLVAYCVGNSGGVWTDGNGWTEWVDLGIAGQSAGADDISWVMTGRKIASAQGKAWIIGQGGDSSLCTWFDPWTMEVGSPVSLPIASARSIVSMDAEAAGITIPDAPGFYINPVTGHITGPSGTQIDPCQPSLGEIVADQCERRGVTSRDVSELTELVGGYRVAAPSTPQRNIQGLQPGYFFSASEFDGTLHFPKRGRPLTFALTHDDFVERDGDPIQWERTQEPELLRKVTVGYVDPETTYTATTQMAERRAATISAEGESTTELAVTGSKDWAAQAADKAMKVAWGEPDECTFHVSIEHAELVTGAEGTVPYTDGTYTAIRIDRIEDEGLVRMVTGRRTRANLYQSNAAGIAKQLPRFPGSNIRGPVDGLLINMPILLDGNDVPGIYWATAGMLSGYIGATLQIFRAGEWVTAGQATGSATMGTLLSPLPSHDRDVDFSNVLHLRINSDLESVTFHNLLSERNPLAILRPDGTAEIVQFQTANEVAAGEYELTTLIRGRLDTGASSHSAGARVVFLDDGVNYASLDPTDLGQTITYRFISIGTDPDTAAVQNYLMATMESQREWQPYRATYQADGDDWIIRFTGRHRLGTDQFPVASAHFMGWRIDFTVGAMTRSHLVQSQEWTYTESQQIADWGSAQSGFDSVTVTAINQYTNGNGAGGAGSGTAAIQL